MEGIDPHSTEDAFSIHDPKPLSLESQAICIEQFFL